MSIELQQITDSLSARLERSVTVDDARLNVLAHSIFGDQVDRMRTDAILRRVTPTDSAQWLFSLGIARATGPIRVPGNNELGQLPRICAPIRSRRILLGYLWVIDPAESLGSELLELVDSEAAFAGQLLYRDRLLDAVSRGRESELARDLLADSAALREAAATELSESGGFVVAGPSAVVVASIGGAVAIDPELRNSLSAVLDQATRPLSPRHCLRLARGREAILIMTVPPASDPHRELHRAADRLAARLHDQLPDGAGRVGIGEPVESVLDLPRSYQQAVLAARVAREVTDLGPVADFGRLGVYRLLAQLTPDQLRPDVLDQGLRRLLRDGSPMMAETLEAYLDAAGEASDAAAALQIHRTTLYYRLGRIQQLTGADLSDGNQRLALHVSLKVARLGGLFPSPVADRP